MKTALAFLLASAAALAALPDHKACLEELLACDELECEASRYLYMGFRAGRPAENVVQAIVYFLREHPYEHATFAYFERILRKNQAPGFLIANSDPPPFGAWVGHLPPFHRTKGRTAPYSVWFELHKENADAVKRRLGIDDEENLRRLEDTGVLLRIDPLEN